MMVFAVRHFTIYPDGSVLYYVMDTGRIDNINDNGMFEHQESDCSAQSDWNIHFIS